VTKHLTLLLALSLCLTAVFAATELRQRTAQGDGYAYENVVIEGEPGTVVCIDEGGNLMPPNSTATIGTTNNPWHSGHFGSNSVTVGGVLISSTNGMIKAPGLIIDGPGESRGRSKFRNADAEFTDYGYGIIFRVAETNSIEYVMTLDSQGNPMTTLIAESPEVPFEVRMARLTNEVSARAAIIAELDLTPAQVAAIQAYFTADIDTLFSNLTANQRQFLKVQRAIVRYMAKEKVKEVR
jgi:hypothetical protein